MYLSQLAHSMSSSFDHILMHVVPDGKTWYNGAVDSEFSENPVSINGMDHIRDLGFDSHGMLSSCI